MPLIKLETTVALPDDRRQLLLSSLSKIAAEIIGKPEKYVMVVVNTADILMSGDPQDSAFVDVRSIGGLDGEVNRHLSQHICALLDEFLEIQQDRIYLNFTDVPAGDWGWKGSTFG